MEKLNFWVRFATKVQSTIQTEWLNRKNMVLPIVKQQVFLTPNRKNAYKKVKRPEMPRFNPNERRFLTIFMYVCIPPVNHP
jgi:hypothetical protein